jgi:hypothetical protein
MNKNCKKKHSQNHLQGDCLYSIKRKTYKTLCSIGIRQSHLLQNGHDFFFIEFFFFLYLLYSWIITIFNECMSTVYIVRSCTLMPQNCIRSGKSCKMYAIFTMFSSSEVSLQHFQIK